MKLHDLANVLVNELAPDESHPEPIRIEGPVFRGINSIVYKGHGSFFSGPVAIKLCRLTNDAEGAAYQYEALVRVSQRYPTGNGMTVPEPVVVIADHGILVTRWIDGVALKVLLRDAHQNQTEICSCLARAGEWLRRFHDCYPNRSAPVDVAHHFDLVTRAIAGHGGESALVARALDVARKSAQTLADIPVPWSWIHGDFKPENVLLGGNQTVGLDMGARFDGPVLLDIAYFLNHLELDLLHPRAIRLIPHGKRLRDAFCEGYDLRVHTPSTAPLSWLRLVSAIGLYANLTPRGAAPMTRLFNRATVGSLVWRLMAAVS